MKIGLFGLGRLGSFHAKTLRELDTVSDLFLWDPRTDRCEAMASELDARPAQTREELFDQCDALVIASSTASHAELLGQALERNMPTYCEKPVAVSLEETRTLAEKAEASGTFVQVGFQRRFDRGFAAAADKVESGAIGDLMMLRSTSHDKEPPHADYIPLSGGIYADLMIHDCDLIRFVSGQEFVQVYVLGSNLGHTGFAEHGDVSQTLCSFELSGGTIGTMSGTRTDPRGYDNRLEIYATRDSLVAGWDARTPLKSLDADLGADPSECYQGFLDRYAPAYRYEIQRFTEAVTRGEESICTVSDAYEAQRVAVASELSRRENRPVPLDQVR